MDSGFNETDVTLLDLVVRLVDDADTLECTAQSRNPGLPLVPMMTAPVMTNPKPKLWFASINCGTVDLIYLLV